MTDSQRILEVTAQRDMLRNALVGLIGSDSREELEAMELVIRAAPVPELDKANTINAIHAVLQTTSWERTDAVLTDVEFEDGSKP